jgi:hypothetical protein
MVFPSQERQNLYEQRIAELSRLLRLAETDQEKQKIRAQINYWRQYA